MEFEFSPLVIGLIILVTIIRIFTSKPKVTPMKGDQANDNQGGQGESQAEGGAGRPQTIEELLGQLIERPQPKSPTQPQRISSAGDEAKIKAKAERSMSNKRAKARGEIRDEIGDDIEGGIGGGIGTETGSARVEDQLNFDLRQAVIMSEILTRKYDE